LQISGKREKVEKGKAILLPNQIKNVQLPFTLDNQTFVIDCCSDEIFLEVSITLVSSTNTKDFFLCLLNYCKKKISSVINKSLWCLHVLFIKIIFTN